VGTYNAFSFLASTAYTVTASAPLYDASGDARDAAKLGEAPELTSNHKVSENKPER
jgi:hypothetical protein